MLSSIMMSKWILLAEIVLISSAVVSLAAAMTFAAPVMINFVVYEMPTLWTALMSFFKPPYVYIIVYGIIIVIVASSRCAPSERPSLSSGQSRQFIFAKTPPPVEIFGEEELKPEMEEEEEEEEGEVLVYEVETAAVEVKKPVVVNGFEVIPPPEEEEVVVESGSAYSPSHEILETETEIPLPVPTEKPRGLLPFGHQTQLRGEKFQSKTRSDNDEATLDDIWRMITQGREVSPPKRR